MSAPAALSIAGSDSGGGAGVQADLKTFAALEVYGFSAITAITAQSTTEVRAIHPVPPEIVRAQLEAVLDDAAISVAKTGMLYQPETVQVVAAVARARGLALVVDPVAAAEKGASLTAEPAAFAAALVRDLFPCARVLTPNLDEAARFLGRRPSSPAEMVEAGRALIALGASNVAIKGGHLEGDPVDVLVEGDGTVTVLESQRVASRSTHGTGCTFASAIAALLARGRTVRDAVTGAQRFVRDAIAAAPAQPDVGRGRGPLHHFHRFHAWPR